MNSFEYGSLLNGEFIQRTDIFACIFPIEVEFNVSFLLINPDAGAQHYYYADFTLSNDPLRTNIEIH